MTSIEKARVVEVLDTDHVILNVGSELGVKLGDQFVVFGRDREITDLNGKSLGVLEVVKGYGKVFHVQESMCILRSDIFTTKGSGFKAEQPTLLPSIVSATGRSMKQEFLVVTRGDFARPV
jgi:hypothetical protein